MARFLCAVRLIVAAKSAPYEKSQEGGRRQSLRRITLQNILKVTDHPLEVGLTNVAGGGLYLVGGCVSGVGNLIAASMES